MITQTLLLLVILLLTVEWKECTTAAVQGDTRDKKSTPYVQILQGRIDCNKTPGPPGPPGPSNGGVVFTRWGKTTCPTTEGTQLLYIGKAAGGYYDHYGGAAEYICLPDDPEFLTYTQGTSGRQAYIYGTEYEAGNGEPLKSLDEQNVPCVVCYVSNRTTYLMIPAKTICPTTWTTEYQGYLMTEHHTHKRNAVFECVDKDAEGIPGSSADTEGSLFFHVQTQCNGIQCPPYSNEKELACVVCTK